MRFYYFTNYIHVYRVQTLARSRGTCYKLGGGGGGCPLQRDLANINVLKIVSLLFHKYLSTFGENIGLYFVNISVNTWLDTFRANHNMGGEAEGFVLSRGIWQTLMY